MKHLRTIAVVASVFASSGAAQAATFWSVPASACVPVVDRGNIPIHKANAASVQFSGANIGTIVLNCPIQPYDGSGYNPRLRLTYQDSTGTNAGAAITVQIRKMTIGTVDPAVLFSASSDSVAITGPNSLTTDFLGAPLDFETNTYWARVVLTRTSSTQTVVFHALTIEGLPF